MKIEAEKLQRTFKSLAKMKILNRLMDFEYHMEMPDLAKSNKVSNHIRRTKQSIEQIQMNLNHVIKTKEEDVLDEFCSEMLDTIEIISMMDYNNLKQFNQDLKQYLEGGEDAA